MTLQIEESLKNLRSIIEDFRSKLPSKIVESEIKFNALILDPEKSSRKELRSILEEFGFGTFTVSTLAEAQALLESIRNLSLVVSVPRPNGDSSPVGVEFLSELKNRYPTIIPILSVSFAEAEFAVGALRKNILGFFIKPYDKKEVIANLTELLYLNDKHNFITGLIHHFMDEIDKWEKTTTPTEN